ncbi:MAG TPA: SIS domain-containing protein [Candidatus Acidoferrum sp.]|jgi:glucosamine--fructose-6-phosphate aminotransferase (isomerizing)|nr:SIS domain-containing protein [Candidatus Acidoferrum sp.]
MSSSPPRSGHPYHMHDAIYAQPGALRLLTRGQGASLTAAAARLAAAPHVWLAGIGSSWHAALVGEALLARVGGLGPRARAIDAFDLVEYGSDRDPAAVVAVTHRGTNRYAAAALSKARAAGAAAVAVTGKGGDGAGAEHVLRTVEQEASSCHTVSYTCALAMLAALAAAVGHDDETARQLDAIPDLLAMLLGQESWEELAARFGGRRRYWFVGGGPNTATAYEGALKLSEAAWATAVGLGCEQFLHGPWAALEPDDVVFLIAPPGPSHARCRDVARVAAEIGAPVVALVAEDDREIAPLAAETIALPAVPELLSPIVAVVPLQLLTYHLAVKAGADPDTMRAQQPAYGRARAVAGS